MRFADYPPPCTNQEEAFWGVLLESKKKNTFQGFELNLQMQYASLVF